MTPPDKSELTRFIAQKCLMWEFYATGGYEWWITGKSGGDISAKGFNPTESISDAWWPDWE